MDFCVSPDTPEIAFLCCQKNMSPSVPSPSEPGSPRLIGARSDVPAASAEARSEQRCVFVAFVKLAWLGVTGWFINGNLVRRQGVHLLHPHLRVACQVDDHVYGVIEEGVLLGKIMLG